MQSHRDFFPAILFPHDLAVMALAHHDAMAQAGCDDLNPDEVARITLRFYRLGVVDDKKLAEVTGLVAQRLDGYVPS